MRAAIQSAIMIATTSSEMDTAYSQMATSPEPARLTIRNGLRNGTIDRTTRRVGSISRRPAPTTSASSTPASAIVNAECHACERTTETYCARIMSR